ncbi:MAG: phytanoyl-CoA dioxygenase family protein [Rhodospirillaceae bacterium]
MAELPEHASAFLSQGYAVVRGVFARDEIAEMARAFDGLYAAAIAGGRNWRDRNTFFCLADDAAAGRIVRYVQWPGWLNPVLERTRRDPRFLTLFEPLIGRDIKQIINQMHWKPPGAAMAEFGFHQDSRSRRPREAYRDLGASYIQTGIAIDPHTASNGAMIVSPQSHRLGELPFDPARPSKDVALDGNDLRALGVAPEHTVVVDMEPGDVALWHVHTLHGSGPNRSEIDRRLYINGYVRAANCDRGEWAFRDGRPCPLQGEPALVHYEDLYTRPGPMFVD